VTNGLFHLSSRGARAHTCFEAVEMAQPRRVSPRIPYDEAICLTRIDGQGRLYGRGLDLSATGLSIVCAEGCPIGTAIRCSLLLPGGPRPVVGRVVRVTKLPRGLGLAIAFEGLPPSTIIALDRLIEARAKQVLPAKLRIDGVDQPLRCEAHDVDGEVVRLTAMLPFLRLDGGVNLVLGQNGGVAQAGTISNIAVDPSTHDGVPRLALDVSLGGGRGPRSATARYGAPSRRRRRPSAPPTRLPPSYGQPLPSVVLAAGLNRDLRAIEERPPRRRVHGTGEVAQRRSLASWSRPQPALANASGSAAAWAPATERLTALHRMTSSSRRLWLLIPAAIALTAALVRLRG
jgi:hypothetical protein